MSLAQLPDESEMYDALVRRDTEYEGVFVVGVRTTGIFCRPTCPARKPRPENVDYFASTQEAQGAGYRPCRRCEPLEAAGAEPAWLAGFLLEVEREPTRAWRDADLRERGLEPARVRRWFQRHHGMTFHAHQRARRLGIALGRIREGADLTDAAHDAGYESPSGFREAFGKLFGAPPGRSRETTPVRVSRVLTPLGTLFAAATTDALCLLEFSDRKRLPAQVRSVQRHLDARFTPGSNDVLNELDRQLGEYFDGSRRHFDLPLAVPGTEFQEAAWAGLLQIPYGETRSYAEQARKIGRPTAVRAVARANGDNRVAIVVPCHRVIASDGGLAGYGGQVWRKRALLELEAADLRART